ncbi:PAS domain S-box protein, partial [Methanosalsum natronophilum]
MQSGKDKYRSLIENLPDAFAYHQIITDNKGEPIDYIFLDVNLAFEKMTGLSRYEILNKKVTDALPELKSSSFDWIGAYGKVAITGENTSFDSYSKPLKRWYKVTAYSDEPGYFATIFSDMTERKEIEEALKDYKEELAAIYENAPITMMLVDKNRKVVKINGYTASFFGKLHGEMIGKLGGEALGCLFALDSPEGCGFGPHCNECNIKNTLLDTMESGNNYHQLEVSRPFIIAGQEKQLFFLLSTIKVNIKGQTMVLVCLQNITERKKAEEALQANEAKYRSIFNSARDILIIYNKEGVIIEANEEACRSYGYSSDELMGMKGQFLVHPNYRHLFGSFIEEMQQKGYYFTEAVDIRKDGSPFYIEVKGSPFCLEGEEHILAIVRDISDRKQDEIALRRREEEFRALAENVPDLISRFDRELRHVYANPALEKELGIPREQIIGRTYADVTRAKDNVHLRNNILREVFEQGKEKEFYYNFKTPKVSRYYHARIVPEFAFDGKTVETVLAITRDITSIKEREAALYQE